MYTDGLVRRKSLYCIGCWCSLFTGAGPVEFARGGQSRCSFQGSPRTRCARAHVWRSSENVILCFDFEHGWWLEQTLPRWACDDGSAAGTSSRESSTCIVAEQCDRWFFSSSVALNDTGGDHRRRPGGMIPCPFVVAAGIE
jgi:hypothetical protein